MHFKISLSLSLPISQTKYCTLSSKLHFTHPFQLYQLLEWIYIEETSYPKLIRDQPLITLPYECGVEQGGSVKLEDTKSSLLERVGCVVYREKWKYHASDQIRSFEVRFMRVVWIYGYNLSFYCECVYRPMFIRAYSIFSFF